ncbi:MAG: PepSY-associated TM helix domain-containing protein [Niabella sp.]
MNNRNYNIYFHTHTISGIIISAILFVIFFAGSFSFFKNEISNWQANTSVAASSKYEIDFNTIADSLNKEYGLYSRNISFYIYPHSSRLGVSVSESKDTTVKNKGGFFYYNVRSRTKNDYRQSYDLGEFIYRLHFLAQVNEIARFGFPLGYYIAGGIAFIFLFALVTGLLLHWNKIVSNFYVFRPWEKLKTVWTDLHTALGVISFPFLFVFAVTGSYFLISYPLFSKPTATFQFGGNEAVLNDTLGYGELQAAFQDQPLSSKADINYFLNQTHQRWPHTALSNLEIVNYGDKSMQVSVGTLLPQKEKFAGSGKMVYEVHSGKILENKSPYQRTGYSAAVQELLYDLHFGNYGGYALKVMYFLLGICGCMVIISGVLIWLTARNKKSIPEKKKQFNKWLIHIYLSVCMSMFPATAAAFIAVKIHPGGGTNFIYPFYFYTWLTLAVLLLIRRDNYKTNRDSLLAGGIIGLFIPVINGLITQNWIWISYSKGYHDILLVDVFWLLISLGAFICWWLIIQKNKQKNLRQQPGIKQRLNT